MNHVSFSIKLRGEENRNINIKEKHIKPRVGAIGGEHQKITNVSYCGDTAIFTPWFGRNKGQTIFSGVESVNGRALVPDCIVDLRPLKPCHIPKVMLGNGTHFSRSDFPTLFK